MPWCGWRFRLDLQAALVASLWSASAAWAQQPERPLFLPKNDVAVMYRFDRVGMNDYHKWQVTYADGGQRVRHDYFRWVEAKYPYVSVIYDGTANRLITVHFESRSYSDRPIGTTDNPGQFFKTSMSFTRLGTSVIAHAQCTEWRVQFPGETDEQDTTCVTDDGIVLRVDPNKPNVGMLTAIAIHYGVPPDGMFDPPATFKREPAR